MSQEILIKIKEAEKEAENIRADAAQKSEKKLAAAHEAGKASKEKKEAEALRDNTEKIGLIKSKANELLQKTKAAADAEVKTLTMSAEIKMREAVKLAVVRALEECR